MDCVVMGDGALCCNGIFVLIFPYERYLMYLQWICVCM